MSYNNNYLDPNRRDVVFNYIQHQGYQPVNNTGNVGYYGNPPLAHQPRPAHLYPQPPPEQMYSRAPPVYGTSNGYTVYSPQTSRPYIQPARIQLAPQDPRTQPGNDNRDRHLSGGNTSSTQSNGSSSQRYSSNSPNNLSEEARKKQADISMEKGTYELLKLDELKTEQAVKKLEEELKHKRDKLKRYREKKEASKRKIDQLEVELARINNQISNSRSTSSQRTSNATSSSFTSSTIANKNMLLAEVNKLLASANTESPTTPSENIRSSLVYGTQVTTRNVVFSKLTLRYNVLTPELMAPQIFIPLKGLKTQFRGTAIRDPRKILLRICGFDQKRNYQIDHINCKFQITINNVMVFGGKKYPLRGPLDITKNIIEGINSLEIKSIETLPQGALNEPLPSCCGICIIQGMKLEPQSTIKMLQNDARYRRTENDTQILIKSKFVKASSSQDVCDVSDVRVPLVCPLTKLRLTLPSFGISCNHLTFFSGDTFVELNQNKDDWSCPVCKKTIGLDELRVDGLIMRILSECKEGVQQVTFDKYAKWKPVEEEQGKTSKSAVSRREVLDDTQDIITLEDSDEEPPTRPAPSTQARVATCSSVPTSSAPSNSQLRMTIRLSSTQSTSSAQPSSQTVEPTPRQPSPVYPVETTERSSPPEEEGPSSSSRPRESSEESEPIVRPRRHTNAPRYAVEDSSSSRSRSTTPATSVSRSSDDEDNREKKKKTTKKRPRLTSSEESSEESSPTDTDSDSDSSTDRRYRKPGPKSKTLPKKNTTTKSTSNTSKRVTRSKKPPRAAAKKAKSYLYS